MYCRTSIILHLARGIAAIGLILSVFFIELPFIVDVIAFMGAIFLLRGCPACWLLSLIDKLTHRRAQKSRLSKD